MQTILATLPEKAGTDIWTYLCEKMGLDYLVLVVLISCLFIYFFGPAIRTRINTKINPPPAAKPPMPEAPVSDSLKEEVQRGIHYLRMMSPELRQALIAEVLELFYMQDGSNAYTGTELVVHINNESVPFKGHFEDVLYRDAQGVSRSFKQVRNEAFNRNRACYSWWLDVKLRIHHAGHKPIFAPFKKEIQAMKQHARL